MKKFNNSNEFSTYKAGLKERISELEESLDFSPQGLLNEVNPFKGDNHEASLGNPMLKSAIKFLPKFLITKAFGKNLNPITSALIPLAATGAGKVMQEIEEQGLIEKLLDKVIAATALTKEDKVILEAAEIENQINAIEDSIYDNSNKVIRI